MQTFFRSCPTLTINVWVLLRPTEVVDIEVLLEGTYDLQSLSESNHLQV